MMYSIFTRYTGNIHFSPTTVVRESCSQTAPRTLLQARAP